MNDLLSFVHQVAELIRFEQEEEPMAKSWKTLFEKSNLFLIVEIIEFKVNDTYNQVNFLMQQFYPGDEFKQEGKINHRIQILRKIVNEIDKLSYFIKKWKAKAIDTTPIGAPNPLLIYLEKIEKGLKNIQNAKTTLEKTKITLTKEILDTSFDNVKFFFEKIYSRLVQIQKTAHQIFNQCLTEKNDHDPMVAMLITFFKLYSSQQEHLNQWPIRHLNYYLKEVLKTEKKAAVPDRTFVQFFLKESADVFHLRKGTRLLADQNEEGLESCYETIRDVSVNKTKIAALQTVYAHQNSKGKVDGIYFAPVANSKDGLGGRIEKETPSWPLFGENQRVLANDKRTMVDADVGFVVGGPILVLNDGDRVIELNITLKGKIPTEHLTNTRDYTSSSNFSVEGFQEALIRDESEIESVQNIFDFFNLQITLPEGWWAIERFRAIFITYRVDNLCEIKIRFKVTKSISTFKLNEEVDSLTFYGLPLEWPAIKILLNLHGENNFYGHLKNLVLQKVNIRTEVTQFDDLLIINSDGNYDNNHPFSFFGLDYEQQPYCLIGHREFFLKNLTDFTLNIDWDNLPEGRNFSKHYAGYTNLSNETLDIKDDSFKVIVAALSNTQFKTEFNPHLLFTTDSDNSIQSQSCFHWDEEALSIFKIKPNTEITTPLVDFDYQTVTGYFKVSLITPKFGFGHQFYANVLSNVVTHNAYAKAAKAWWKINKQKELPLPYPPFTPKAKRVYVDYVAKSEINFAGERKLKYQSDKAMEIYQVQPTGYLPVFEKGKIIENKLLRSFKGFGALMIGLQDIEFEKPLNIYFKLLHVDNHLLDYPNEYEWYYLSSNRFLPLKEEQLYYDTTHSLAKNGVISLYIPPDINRANTLLPNDCYWLMVAAKDKNTYGRAYELALNAVEVKWIDNGNIKHYKDPSSLPQITEIYPKLEAISKVVQLDNFFGGWSEETDQLLGMRISERLRHKGRALTLWDFERLVLSKFPDIWQAKCIPVHSVFDFVGMTTTDAADRGSVRVVVVSDKLNEKNLTPFLSIDERLIIQNYLAKRATANISIKVINPSYEFLKLKMKILLDEKLANQKGVYLKKIYQDLTHFICPWLEKGFIRIGEGISQRALVQFLVSLPYIKYVTSLSVVHIYKVYKSTHSEGEVTFEYKLWDSAKVEGRLSNKIMPSCPWGILVPSKIHTIEFLEEAIFEAPITANVDNMNLETDFVIGDELEIFDEDIYLTEEEGNEQISFYF